MYLVGADTSPIYYLLSIDEIEVLPRLFGKVFLPDAVYKELGHPAAPNLVPEWAASLLAWAEVAPVEAIEDAALEPLGSGEAGLISRIFLCDRLS